MSIKFGVALFVIVAALATTTYAAEQKGGSSHGGGGGSHGGGASHGSSGGHASHGGSEHGGKGGESHASHGGDSKGGGKGGKGGGKSAGKGGKVHAGFAGAFRNPLYWLYWPFAYYSGPDQWALTCGEDVTDVTGMPVDAFHEALQPTGQLAAALDDLALAQTKAVQDIRIACPTEMALTAPGRIAVMQRRIEAMIAAIDLVQPALDKFYGLLNDEQKAKLNAISIAARPVPPPGADEESFAENCGPSQLAGMELPAADIDHAVHLTDPERAGLIKLQNADTQAAADLLKSSCGADNPITPPARVAAARKRLDAMLEAVKMVSAAMGDFYGMLTDEQKAHFDAIGPVLASEEVEPEPEPAAPVVRRVVPPPIVPVIRNILRF